MSKYFSLVSIIITSKNEVKNIETCLKSIKKQNCPQSKIEIIVVDNNSTDKTVKVAKKYTSQVFNKGPERSAQRNYGMKIKSKGKYLMYLDADMSISPQLISNAVKMLENEKIGALYIKELIKGNGFWIKVRNFERKFYTATVVDAVRIMTREILLKTNGFDESLTGPEDWDFDKRVRRVSRVALLPEKMGVIYHNEGSFNLKKYLSKKNYYIKDFKKYQKKWGKNDSDINRQFSAYYRMLGVFVENKKYQRLIKHPILSLGLFYLRFRVALKYLFKK